MKLITKLKYVPATIRTMWKFAMKRLYVFTNESDDFLRYLADQEDKKHSAKVQQYLGCAADELAMRERYK